MNNILTPQQFRILKYLYQNGEKSGRQIRNFLEQENIHSGKVAYYLLMGRAHAAGLVNKKERQIIIGDQRVIEHTYNITEKGLQMLNETYKFYQL